MPLFLTGRSDLQQNPLHFHTVDIRPAIPATVNMKWDEINAVSQRNRRSATASQAFSD